MASKNDITGDSIQTGSVTDQYRNNYDLIFRKNKIETNEYGESVLGDMIISKGPNPEDSE